MRYSYAPLSAAADARAILPPAPPPPPYAVLTPARPYDLATPGTPRGVLGLARAAAAGGWRGVVTFALVVDLAGAPVASLALRLRKDGPPARRAYAVYVRRSTPDGTSKWAPSGAAAWEDGAPARALGVAELSCILAGVEYVPPAPRAGPPRLACYTCDKVTPFSTTTWQPYARHRCDSGTTEGRS